VLTRGGKGVKKDLKRANTLLRSAAEGGNYWGMEQYAYALLNGDGTGKPDSEGAGFWMVKSIGGDNSEALDQMISNYDNGYMRDKAF
jgi:TPR repeat protein